MKQELSIVRGTSNAFGITVMDANGDPLVLAEGDALVFALKKKPKDETRVLVKKITNYVSEEGAYYLELEPSDTSELDAGKYFYDIGLQNGTTTFHNIIEASVFEIKPNISELGDGA